MPVFPPYFDDLCEVRCIGTHPNGQVWENVFFVDRQGIGTFLAEAAEIAASFETFYAAWADRRATTVGFGSIEVVDRSSDAGATFIDAIAANGTDATEPLPGQIALVVTWLTGQGGRRRRGRTYLCGFAEAQNSTGGFPATACVADVQAAADALITNLQFNSHSLAVLSRGGPTKHKDGTETEWTPFYTEVASAVVDATYDTQRRRGR